MTVDQLHEFLSRVGRPHVCVVGDLTLDTYVWGQVSRVSPEGPIPVLRVQNKEDRPGGAASVAVMLEALGADVSCVGAVGRDPAGATLRRLLEERGLNTAELVECEGRLTAVMTRYMGYVQSAGRALQQIVRVDEETREPLNEGEIDRIKESMTTHLGGADLVVVEDMGFFPAELVADVVQSCRAAGTPVIADPQRGIEYSRYSKATCIMPNRFEAERTTGVRLTGETAFQQAGRKLLEELSLEAVLVKLDRDGIFCMEKDGQCKHFPASVRDVADVTGAGDMVTAAIALVLGAGGSYLQAASLANFAAGIEVSRRGAAPVSRSELLDELLATASPIVAKIKTREEIGRILAQKRAEHQTIAFTNGCFDLLHLGHVELVRHASAQGDVLVVGVNSDKSVRELKGPGRPINSEGVRARVLASLSDVDYVVLFDEASVLSLVKEVRPDVLVKGGDYGKEGVVGHEFIESYGGKVELAPKVEGFSTTELIEKIGQNNERGNQEHSD